MPSYDENGKRLSGAQQRKSKREVHDRAAEEPQSAINVGPPPLDSTTRITWASDVVAQTLYAASQDRQLIGPERYRIISSLASSLGMLRDKAAEQERLDRLASKAGLKQGAQAVKGLEPFAGTVKPPTARGTRKPGDRKVN